MLRESSPAPDVGKKKPKNIQAQMDGTQPFSSSNVKKQACIEAYFARNGFGPIRTEQRRDPVVRVVCSKDQDQI